MGAAKPQGVGMTTNVYGAAGCNMGVSPFQLQMGLPFQQLMAQQGWRPTMMSVGTAAPSGGVEKGVAEAPVVPQGLMWPVPSGMMMPMMPGLVYYTSGVMQGDMPAGVMQMMQPQIMAQPQVSGLQTAQQAGCEIQVCRCACCVAREDCFKVEC